MGRPTPFSTDENKFNISEQDLSIIFPKLEILDTIF